MPPEKSGKPELWLKNKGQFETAILSENDYLDAGFSLPCGLVPGGKNVRLGLLGFPGFSWGVEGGVVH